MAEVYGVGLYILFLISGMRYLNSAYRFYRIEKFLSQKVTIGLILYLCLYLGLSEATRAKLTVSLRDKESLSSRSNSTEPVIEIISKRTLSLFSRSTSQLTLLKCAPTWESAFTTTTPSPLTTRAAQARPIRPLVPSGNDRLLE